MSTQVPYMFCVFICKLFQASHLWCHTFTWLYCFLYSRISFQYNAYYLHLSPYCTHSLFTHVHHHLIITVIACIFYFSVTAAVAVMTNDVTNYSFLVLRAFLLMLILHYGFCNAPNTVFPE